MPKILEPTLDVVFKLMFAQPGQQELLASLLTAVLHPPSPIASVVVLNPEQGGKVKGQRAKRKGQEWGAAFCLLTFAF